MEESSACRRDDGTSDTFDLHPAGPWYEPCLRGHHLRHALYFRAQDAARETRFSCVRRSLPAHLVLRAAQLPEDAYDIILIDCPPNFNIVTKNAIVASDYILIPAKPDYLSTMGIDYLKNSLDKLVKEYNEYISIEDSDLDDYEPINPQILGVVFTMVQYYGEKPISALRPFIAQTKQLGFDVFEDTLRENKTLFADAAQYGVPVVISKRNSGINVIDGINGIVNELLDKLGYE